MLVGTAAAMATGNSATALNTGPHGLSEVLYAFTSAANNNGSAFAGLTVNTPGGTPPWAWHAARPVPADRARARAWPGRSPGRQPAPASAGTLPTHQPLFVGMLVGVTVILVALTFLPALALGPLAEGL